VNLAPRFVTILWRWLGRWAIPTPSGNREEDDIEGYVEGKERGEGTSQVNFIQVWKSNIF
jgi:hypothetical protein